ncbi:hypothetical protein [Prosthecobacter sp.]|uniref:hypothetical protein n=1 Tax=Prosthecobacter sp. TaxID=1965333 RepID=UPI0037847CC7
MALDTLNNGDSGLQARTKINAAIAAVNSAVFASQAWIEPDSGSDVTGTIESSGKPFATIQAAYDAGAHIFHIGKGSAGDLVLSPLGDSIQLAGLGSEVSSMGSITSAPTSNVTYSVRGNGIDAIKIAGISIIPPVTPVDGTAFSGGNLHVKGFTCTGDIYYHAANGGNGHAGLGAGSPASPVGGANGQPGGAGPNIYAEDVVGGICASVAGSGGNGGMGGDSTDSSTSGAAGGQGGDGGYGGGVEAVRSVFTQIAAVFGPAGTGGSGGSGAEAGTNGADGAHGPYGSASARFCDITSDCASNEMTTLRFCAVANSWYA